MDSLARRVRWLDRYRRWVAIGIAAALAPALWSTLAESFISIGFSVLLGTTLLVGLWLLLEVAFAYIAAVWETEHNEIASANGLPRAVIRRRK